MQIITGQCNQTSNRSSNTSDSTQSPPLQPNKAEKCVQTNVESHEQGEISRQADEKKAKEMENLVRMNTELKQNLEVQRIKIRASKETIRRLLVEQSRMERKKVGRN